MSHKKRPSAQKQITKACAEILKEDKVIDGKEFKKGDTIVPGANCPRCKTFYPGAMRVVACNRCGHRSKTLKPWQIKKKQKMLKRQEYEKAAKEAEKNKDNKPVKSLKDQGMGMRPIEQGASQ